MVFWYLLSASLVCQGLHLVDVVRHEKARQGFFPVDLLWTLSLALSESSVQNSLSYTSSLCFLSPLVLYVLHRRETYSPSCLMFCFLCTMLSAYSSLFWKVKDSPFQPSVYHSLAVSYNVNDTTAMVAVSFSVLQILIEYTSSVQNRFVNRVGNALCITVPFFVSPDYHVYMFCTSFFLSGLVFVVGLFVRAESVANRVLYTLSGAIVVCITALYAPQMDAVSSSCYKTTLVSFFHVSMAAFATMVYYYSCECKAQRTRVGIESFTFLVFLVLALPFMNVFERGTDGGLTTAINGMPSQGNWFNELTMRLPPNATVDDCRSVYDGADNEVIVYRKASHPTMPYTCFAYTRLGVGDESDGFDWFGKFIFGHVSPPTFSVPEHHVTYCVNPLASPLNGCIHEGCLSMVRIASLASILAVSAIRMLRICCRVKVNMTH